MADDSLSRRKDGRKFPVRGTKLNPEQVRSICQRYIDGENSPALAKEFGVLPGSIRALLRHRGIPRRTKSEAMARQSVNHHAFDDLSSEALYWIGFIFADGHIQDTSLEQTTRWLSVLLAARDIDHLRKLNSFLQSTYKITEYVAPGNHQKCKMGVRSPRICTTLRNLGCHDKLHRVASQTLTRSRDFWRGIVDGDGCLSIHRTKRQRVSNPSTLTVCGGLAIVAQFVSYVLSIVPDFKGQVRRHGPTLCYVARIEGWRALAVIKTLYDNPCTALDRKYAKYKRLLSYDL